TRPLATAASKRCCQRSRPEVWAVSGTALSLMRPRLPSAHRLAVPCPDALPVGRTAHHPLDQLVGNDQQREHDRDMEQEGERDAGDDPCTPPLAPREAQRRRDQDGADRTLQRLAPP